MPGLFWGLLVAFGYAATNLCLRAAAVETDPLVGAAIRAIPTSLVAWALVLRQSGLRPFSGLSLPVLAPLLVVSVLFNLTGNGGFQVGLALVGLTVAVPVSQAAVLWGGGLGGWLLMRERLTRRGALGLMLLALSLPLLTAGGGGGGSGPLWLGVVASIVAGMSYGGGNALLRQTILRFQLHQPLAIAPIATLGILMLLVVILLRQGPSAFTELAPLTVTWLLAAGAFNAVAVLSLSKALTLLPVSRVNAFGNLQTAISALGGVLIFAEPMTGLLLAGLTLALGGALLSQTGRR